MSSSEVIKVAAAPATATATATAPGEAEVVAVVAADSVVTHRDHQAEATEGAALEEELKQELEAAEPEIQEEAKAQQQEAEAEAAATSAAAAAVQDTQEDEKLSDGEKEEKIVQEAVKQITFYLSDSNLPYDKFLFTQAQKSLKDANEPMGTGWIPLDVILSFKRMQEIVSKSSRSATICEFAIVNALRAAYPSSDESALLQVSDGGEEIRRRKPLVPPSQTGQMDRSIYAKGFPEEESAVGGDSKRAGEGRSRPQQQHHSTRLQQELEKFFSSLGVGKVNAVRMRRDEQKKFKGSVFVEFATLDSAKAFLELDPVPTYPGQDKPLEVMSKRGYVDMKAKEHGIEPQYKDAKESSDRPQQGTGRFNKRPFNAFKDWKDGKDISEGSNNDHRRGDGNHRRNRDDGRELSGPVEVFVEGKKLEVDTETGKIKHPENIEYQSGKVARFEGASTSDASDPIDLKRALQSIQPCAFVDFERGNSSGVVFFKDVLSEANFKAIQEAGLSLGGDDNKLSWTLITGDEEKEYHVERAHKRASIALADAKSGNTRDHSDRRRNNDGGRGGRGRGRGRGGRGGFNNRDGGRDNRGGRRDNRDRDERREDNNNKKREREEDAMDEKPKGNAISVPQADSRGPANDGPSSKKVKTDN